MPPCVSDHYNNGTEDPCSCQTTPPYSAHVQRCHSILHCVFIFSRIKKGEDPLSLCSSWWKHKHLRIGEGFESGNQCERAGGVIVLLLTRSTAGQQWGWSLFRGGFILKSHRIKSITHMCMLLGVYFFFLSICLALRRLPLRTT